MPPTAHGESPSPSTPHANAILLVAADKSGLSNKRFYRELIRKADERFDRHLARLSTKGTS